MSKSDLEAAFLFYLHTLAPDLPEPEQEWRFCDHRRFRFDFAWPEHRVAVECEGGVWMQTSSGRSKGHAHPVRFESDCEKHNLAIASGWKPFRVTAGMLERDPIRFIEMIANIINKEGLHD